MSHWRANARPDLGGQASDRALSLGSYTPSESILVPTDPALKRGKFSQALLDIGALLSFLLLVSSAGIGIAASIFLLLFVRL